MIEHALKLKTGQGSERGEPMHFTIVIEFLIPGLLTTLIALGWLKEDSALSATITGDPGDTATVLLLLAIAYPMGHVVNFPTFHFLQRLVLAPRARRSVLREYQENGVDLSRLARHYLSVPTRSEGTKLEIRHLFGAMRTYVSRQNIEIFRIGYLHYQSLQRLTRGMLLPALLAILSELLGSKRYPVVFMLLLSLATLTWLLYHCIQKEEERIADFFVSICYDKERPRDRKSSGAFNGSRTQGPASEETRCPACEIGKTDS